MDTPQHIACLLFEGVEEIEAVTPIDILRRAGSEVRLAAPGPGLEVAGRSGIALRAECLMDSIDPADFAALVIPGGPGIAKLREAGAAAALAARFAEAGRWVAAICAAPLVVHDAGLLSGRRHTAHRSAHEELQTPEPAEPVVSDGRILTSRGAGTALPFALELVKILHGEEKAAAVADAIMA